MKPQASLRLLLKAKHFPPDRAAEMLRSVISTLRHFEPHGREAHEASMALSVLVEAISTEAAALEILWDIAFIRLASFDATLDQS
jgi:DNA-directed RNA polymerase specialized sigma54-like protein